MLKRLFQISSENGSHSSTHRNGEGGHGLAVADPQQEATRPSAKSAGGPDGLGGGTTASFEQVYQNAAVKPSRISYSILKVSDMVNSTHLAGMSPEAKRCALMMALDAAGSEVENLLQDAVVRQRALSDFEAVLQEKLQKFEGEKAEENRAIQAELDRLTKQYMSRIQSNLDEVAHEQDEFHAWQERKQREADRITEAATFCVPQGSTAGSPSLTAVLERANIRRR
jgi:hypothetical protein